MATRQRGVPPCITRFGERLHGVKPLTDNERLHGVKPLTDKDRARIRKDVDEKVLRGQPIRFQSSAVELADSRLTVRGELTIAGVTRPASFDLDLSADGRVAGTLPLTQSEWGIKPFRADVCPSAE